MSPRVSFVSRRSSRSLSRLLFALTLIVALGNAAHAVQLCVNSNVSLETALSIASFAPDA